MQDVTEHFRGSGFKVFAGMIEKDPKVRVWAIPAPTGGSRAFCDRMNAWAQGEGQPGLGYIFWREERRCGGRRARRPRTSAPERAGGDPERSSASRTATPCSSPPATRTKFYKFAGAARDAIGTELKLIDESQFALAWIVDFPFYEWNEEDKKIDFSHNPFSMPQGGLASAGSRQGATRTASRSRRNQYDIVCNGFEIASGSVRNHRPETMVKAFEITGLGKAEVEERFGGLYRAFQYGAPPHGGMAAGIDRIVMLLVGAKNLREISLFPMNQQANDLLMGAPSEVAPKQLRELHIRVVAPEKKE